MMASKGKDKLGKKQIKVKGKVIDLERFAYDTFVHSAVKFGVPEKCLCRWEGVENDYGYPDFILVLSRFVLRCQILRRNYWYNEFKRYYESTKFKSFNETRSSLQRILYDNVRLSTLLTLVEVTISLSLISEFIIFLYTNNCRLYLMDLVRFWCGYWLNRKKDIEKAGGLEDLYGQKSNPEEEKVDVFLNVFIPAHCIPYCESITLRDVFEKEFHKFSNLKEETIDMIEKRLREQVTGQNTFVNQRLLQYNLTRSISSGNEASGMNVPVNPALGIHTHEDSRRNVYETDTTASTTDPPSTSRPRIAKERNGSFSQKERQRKKTSTHSSVEALEALNTGLLGGADAAATSQNLPSTSHQETEIERIGLSSQKEASRSGVEDIERLHSVFLGVGARTLSQDLSRTSYLRTLQERKKLASQKVRKGKKISSRSSVDVLEPLNTGLLGADAAATSQNLPSTSRQETEMKHIGLPINLALGIPTHEDLLRNVYGTDITASTTDLPSTSRSRTVREHKGSSSQKERQRRKTSTHSSVEALEPLNTGLLGADAAATSQNLPSTCQEIDREHRGLGSQQEEQKKFSSCLSVEELEKLNLDSE